jgi:hypothetical protein
VDEQLSVVLGERYVFTFQERFGDVFEGVRERLRNARGRIRNRGADYLAYALADAVVDHYFHVLEGIGDVAEVLETEVLDQPTQSTMHQLHSLKRELISVRRAVWPVREMLATLVRSGEDIFTEETLLFMRDVHDHAVQVAETVETLRDVVSGGIDLYLSNVGYRTNEVMKVLTSHVSRRALRHELRVHARTARALGLSRAPRAHGRGRRRDGGVLQEEGLAVAARQRGKTKPHSSGGVPGACAPSAALWVITMSPPAPCTP